MDYIKRNVFHSLYFLGFDTFCHENINLSDFKPTGCEHLMLDRYFGWSITLKYKVKETKIDRLCPTKTNLSVLQTKVRSNYIGTHNQGLLRIL